MLFRNRLAALGFVLFTIISAMSLVGTENQDGVIAKTTAQIETQKAEFETAIEDLGQPAPLAKPPITQGAANASAEAIQFTSDEELIDEAEGFDPTPTSEFKPEAIAETEEVTIILNNKPVAE